MSGRTIESSFARWRVLGAAGIIVLAGLLAYHNSFGGPFIFDDRPSIPENPTIRRLWPIWEVVRNKSQVIRAQDLTIRARSPPIKNRSRVVKNPATKAQNLATRTREATMATVTVLVDSRVDSLRRLHG